MVKIFCILATLSIAPDLTWSHPLTVGIMESLSNEFQFFLIENLFRITQNFMNLTILPATGLSTSYQILLSPITFIE